MFKKQVENHSKIDNSENNQKSKTSKSILSKTWKENVDNMIDIMIHVCSDDMYAHFLTWYVVQNSPVDPLCCIY